MENYTGCRPTDSDGAGYWHARPFERFRIYECFFILIGIIGNSLVIYIQSKLSELRHGGTKSTNRLIICLATADLLTAIFLAPIPIFVNIPDNAAGNFYCHFINSRYLLWVSFRASVYTLTTIAIERLFVVAHPYTYKACANKNYTKYAIPAIWLCPMIIRFPMMYFRVVGKCGRCATIFPSTHSRTFYGIFLFLTEFIFPVVIIIYTSIRIVNVLRRDRFNQGDKVDPSARQQSTQLQSMRRRFTIMFVFICMSFILLWTPDQLGIFLFRLRVIPRAYTSKAVFDVFVTISFLNAAIANPIIYTLCLPTFRRAVKGLLMCQGMNQSLRPIIMDMTSTSMTPSSV